MKTGSLVECIESCLGLSNFGLSKGEPIVKGSILTVRLITVSTFKKAPIIYFEEITNSTCVNTGREYGYPVSKFRELLPPMELEIAELLKQPEYVAL